MTLIIDKYWNDALELIESEGWQCAQGELKRRAVALEKGGKKKQDELENALLILATLQQKFGELSAATSTLKLLEKSNNQSIALDATVRMAKVLSQRGDFETASFKFQSILPDKSTRSIWSHPDNLSSSVLWRFGFLKGISGELKESLYWLDRHKDLSSSHGSQVANNRVFANLVKLVSRDFDYVKAHDENKIGIRYYLKDTLSVDSVKFLNISKSVVVPLLLDGLILLSLRNTFAGVLQLLLCRRLIQFEGLSLASEGIGETIASLQKIEEPFTKDFIKHFNAPEKNFLIWLEKLLKDKRLCEYLISEREEIFKRFIDTRDYEILSIFPETNLQRTQHQEENDKMTENKKVFIVHGHDGTAKVEAARFIERLGYEAIILHEQASSGRTIIEKIENYTNVDFAIVLYTPDDVGNVKTTPKQLNERARQNVVFEHGYLVGKLGRKKVAALVSGNIELPKDISGIVYIALDNANAWHLQLAKEMKNVGYNVDLNKLI